MVSSTHYSHHPRIPSLDDAATWDTMFEGDMVLASDPGLVPSRNRLVEVEPQNATDVI